MKQKLKKTTFWVQSPTWGGPFGTHLGWFLGASQWSNGSETFRNEFSGPKNLYTLSKSALKLLEICRHRWVTFSCNPPSIIYSERYCNSDISAYSKDRTPKFWGKLLHSLKHIFPKFGLSRYTTGWDTSFLLRGVENWFQKSLKY